MRRLNLAKSTRSIYLSLACLSLALHLLLAFFCLSILQTACILPPSSSIRDTDPVQYGSHPSPLDAERPQRNMQSSHPAGEDSFSRSDKEVKGHSKLEALFRHPLYNLPRPPLQEDDWLLRVRTSGQTQDGEHEGYEEEPAISANSEW